MMQRGRGVLLMAGAVLALVARAVAAQDVEKHDFGSGEGKLMGFYTGALLFTPGMTPLALAPGDVVIEGEAGYIPTLSEAQRTFNGQKTESTNLLSVFPRPRVVVGLPWSATLEASWLPPLKVGGVKPNVFSAAISKPIATIYGTRLGARIAGQYGTVTAAITCNESLKTKSSNDSLYYHFVCHDHESADQFKPRVISAELIAQRWNTENASSLLGAPYLGVGVADEMSRFEPVVYNFDGSRDPNHPLLELTATRAYGYLGTSWVLRDRIRIGGEMVYAPGSLFTGRLSASYALRGVR